MYRKLVHLIVDKLDSKVGLDRIFNYTPLVQHKVNNIFPKQQLAGHIQQKIIIL